MKNQSKNLKEDGIQATAELIDAFGEQLTLARPYLASVRCLSRSNLIEIVLKAREVATSPVIRDYSATQLVQLLENAAALKKIPLQQPATSKKLVQLYSVGFNPTGATIPAAELLQAHIPQGILCYFSAIELHGLSTQVPPHYHIGKIRAEGSSHRTSAPPSSSDKPLPLGTLEFFSEDIGFYSTQRDARRLQGIQRRQLNPYCTVTVTNLEQTLLDCLHRPRSAGGPAVVFEAWENGILRTSGKKILHLAEKFNDQILIRRAGYMIERFTPESEALQIAKNLIRHTPQENAPTLLPGIPYQQINKEWGLRTP